MTGTLTDYHAKYLAHELTRRAHSESVERFAAVLADAQVDLNPHQVEAALFAFRSPFSKGAILADEVGLGKTIEAGLLLSQKWAEGKRHLLVIVPSSLRKQWAQELADKFFLPSLILEARSFNEVIKSGNLNPFDQPGVVLCSYQFARNKEPYVRQTPWNLVVIDEAHRLRNVYKKTSKIALSIRDSLAPFPKVLLTATPLQNSLLELYGLVSIIDEYAFGDVSSYKKQYVRASQDGDFSELKERLRPICKRTLRRQVLEYVRFTNRHALVQEFFPSVEEQQLYDLVTEYLQRPRLFALPARQRQLITLVLRKLLASSTYAIAGTLEGLVNRLQEAEDAADAVESAPSELPDEYEDLDELADEWDEEGEDHEREDARATLSPEELAQLRAEKEDLRRFMALAGSIAKNAKGEVLLTALRRGFEDASRAQEAEGAPTLSQKAIVFTESRRTQNYLFELLQQTEFTGKVMLFNGSNSDPTSKAIYESWVAEHQGTDRVSGSRAVDMRAALVEHFRDHASIMIATEAAAEGVNLQFCNLVVNYDLPWNPQRVEQRIGRCHRYGQRYDVVVVNFLNKRNAADQRVYELLDQKFRLFDGVFGASDEILGAIGSGVDFERRIADIYQQCRTTQQIQFEFGELQKELEEVITEGQRDAREKLLDNFDREVVEKVRIESADALDRFNERLWRLTRYLLDGDADFEDDGYGFTLRTNPFPGEVIHPGPYRMARAVDDANTYRVGHPLAKRLLDRGRSLDTPARTVTFELSAARPRISILEPLLGGSGWLACERVTLSGLETEDLLTMAGLMDVGGVMESAQCSRLFDLPGYVGDPQKVPEEVMSRLAVDLQRRKKERLEAAATRDGRWFDTEMDKLDRWAEDRRTSLRLELEELDQVLREAKREARVAPTLPDKLDWQRKARALETKRENAWRAYDESGRDIERQKDEVLDTITKRLDQQVDVEHLFTIRWNVT